MWRSVAFTPSLPPGFGKRKIGALRSSEAPTTLLHPAMSDHPSVRSEADYAPSACKANPLSSESKQKAPTLTISIAGTTVPALLDTGASISLLGDVALKIAKKRRITIRPANSKLKLACGEATVYGTLRLRLKWKGGSCRQRFLVVPGLNLPAILGRDFFYLGRI